MENLPRTVSRLVVPDYIYNNPLVRPSEYLLLAEIDSFNSKGRKCFASNAHFAELLNVTQKHVSRMISKARKKGLISCEYKWRRRQIKERIITSHLKEISEGAYEKMRIPLRNDAEGTYTTTITSTVKLILFINSLRSLITNNNLYPQAELVEKDLLNILYLMVIGGEPIPILDQDQARDKNSLTLAKDSTPIQTENSLIPASGQGSGQDRTSPIPGSGQISLGTRPAVARTGQGSIKTPTPYPTYPQTSLDENKALNQRNRTNTSFSGISASRAPVTGVPAPRSWVPREVGNKPRPIIVKARLRSEGSEEEERKTNARLEKARFESIKKQALPGESNTAFLTPEYCREKFSPAANSIFNFWNKQPNVRKALYKKNATLDSFKRIERALKKGSTEEEIKATIEDYNRLLDENFTIFTQTYSSKKYKNILRVGLLEFFGFSAWTRENLAKIVETKNGQILKPMQEMVSYFDVLSSRSYDEALKYFSTLGDSDRGFLVKTMISDWEGWTGTTLSRDEINLIVAATYMIDKFVKDTVDNRYKDGGKIIDAENCYIRYLSSIIEEQIEEDSIKIHYLASENWYRKVKEELIDRRIFDE